MMEIWKEVPGTSGQYQASALGRIRSIDHTTLHRDGKITRHKSRVLKTQLNHKGYPQVRITVSGRKMSFLIHRLVAELFIHNEGGLPEVNHKDEDKANNNVDNLEWCTTAYNVDYSQSKSCELVSPEGIVYLVRNFAKFARDYGLSKGKISCLVNGNRTHHKGWKVHDGTTYSTP